MRLIDADRLKKTLHACFGGVSHAVIAEQLIDEAPTIDPVKHGIWIKRNDEWFDFVACSVCGKKQKEETNYCPQCDARMDFEAK